MLLGALLLQCATAFAFQETDVPITAPERGGDHPALVEEGNGLVFLVLISLVII